jgi:hypothetical protein
MTTTAAQPATEAAEATDTGAASAVDLGRGPVGVVAGDGRIERNAVGMLLAEVRERYGADWRDGAPPGARARVVLVLDGPPELGSDGFAHRVEGVEVRVSAATPRGLLYGAAALLDRLTDEGLAIPAGTRTETPWSTYRASRVGSIYEPEHELGRSAFEARYRYLARHRFNVCAIAPDRFRHALRYRYVPGLEGVGDEAEAAEVVESTRALIEEGRSWGLDVYLTLSEIDYPDELIERFPELRATAPPDADRTYSPPTAGGQSTLYVKFGVKPNLCLSQPKTWEFVEGKVRELTELFPEAAGFTLSLNGTDSDVFFCDCPRCRPLSKTERAALTLQHIDRGLERGAKGRPKTILFSPYMGAWKNILEPEVYLPLAGKLPKSVALRLNMSYGDTYLFNALNPLLGAFVGQGNDELCDFDPGGEYHGGFFGMQPTISRYLDERIKAYAGRGVRGFSFRNHQYHTHFSELDWYVGARLAWDPTLDVEALRTTWARRAFGEEGGEQVLALLDLGFEVMRRTLYAGGLNFTNWGLFIESVNRTRHILIDRCAKHADRGLERVAPTPENIARLVAEKEEAFQLAEDGIRAVTALRGKVAPRYQEALRQSFLVFRELARVYRPLLEGLLRYFQFEATLSEVDRERLRRPILDAVARLRAAVAEAQANLGTIDAKQLCEQLGMSWVAFNSNKGLYSQDQSVTRMDQKLALPYALRFADDLEERMSYVPASVFGYY